ncbi:MAG: DUF512 domain-containing protein [Lachnospiraceae bacterium]|nr:DUF512 domain-containing protein [Lachnospiraceae bacterium]
MKKEKGHVITGIKPDSIAEELGVEIGDKLISINDTEIEDIFDYRYLTDDEELTLLIYSAREKDYYECDISKEADEELGFEFGDGLMDDYRSCSNKCIFCFIDQMPPGMRETLYFKDDDARLSFLQGNYITLTNMKQKDIDKVCFYKLSPINVSIHTTNPELRCKMLNNRFAGEALKKIRYFCDAGIELNGQVVLCRGVNDGAELDRTLKDIEDYLPNLKSISVVPIGLTKYRKGLFPMKPFEKEDACGVLDQIERWQKYYKDKYGTNLVYASDEWYLTSERELPTLADYEGFPQIENGVGMLRSLMEEFDEASQNHYDIYEGRVLMLTGMAPYKIIKLLADRIMEQYPQIHIDVMPIINDFFGHRITVTGLITGRDILRQVWEKYGPDAEQTATDCASTECTTMCPVYSMHGTVTSPQKTLDKTEAESVALTSQGEGMKLCDEEYERPFDRNNPEDRICRTLAEKERILNDFNSRNKELVKDLPFDFIVVPSAMLRAGERVFLDDISVDDLQNALQKDIRIVKSGGEEFFKVLCRDYSFETAALKNYNNYEIDE